MPNTSHGSLELASVCFLNNALICLSTVFQLCKHGRLCNMSNRTRDRYFSLYSCLLLYSLFWIPIYWKSAFKILSDDLKVYYCTYRLKLNIKHLLKYELLSYGNYMYSNNKMNDCVLRVTYLALQKQALAVVALEMSAMYLS